jgi:hypothetical protein
LTEPSSGCPLQIDLDITRLLSGLLGPRWSSSVSAMAGDVFEDLGSLMGSPARRLHDAESTRLPSGAKPFVPVARMFTLLDLEFEPHDVRRSVARMQKPGSAVDKLHLGGSYFR